MEKSIGIKKAGVNVDLRSLCNDAGGLASRGEEISWAGGAAEGGERRRGKRS